MCTKQCLGAVVITWVTICRCYRLQWLSCFCDQLMLQGIEVCWWQYLQGKWKHNEYKSHTPPKLSLAPNTQACPQLLEDTQILRAKSGKKLTFPEVLLHLLQTQSLSIPNLFLFASLSIPTWDVFWITTKSLFLFLVFCQSECTCVFCSLALSNTDKYCYLDMVYPKRSHGIHPQSIRVLHRNHQELVNVFCNRLFFLFCFCTMGTSAGRAGWQLML